MLTCTCMALINCTKEDSPTPTPVATPIDYREANSWLVIADRDLPVDIFYVYPTVYNGSNLFSDINDPKVRAEAAHVYERQASLFAPLGNIYAPHYRQMGGPILGMSLEEQHKYSDSLPRLDLMAAFEYFLQHYNKERPFIIASQSQGSQHILRHILGPYMATHPDVYARMIAAYVIGYGVTSGYLADYPHLKFATGAIDLGVIISYNTEMPGVTAKNPVLPEGSIAINPVNWKRDATPATAAENLPSRIETGYNIYENRPAYADAKLNPSRGVVECSTQNPDDYVLGPPFPYGSYHTGDYPLYYYSLRKNTEDRINAWFNQAD